MPIYSMSSATSDPWYFPGATHCDLYDGGEGNYIPWDTLAEFFGKNM